MPGAGTVGSLKQTTSWWKLQEEPTSILCLETLPSKLLPRSLLGCSFLQEALLNLPFSWAHAWTLPQT